MATRLRWRASSSARAAAIAARAAGPGVFTAGGEHRGVPGAVLVGGDLVGQVAAGRGEHLAEPPGQHAGQVSRAGHVPGEQLDHLAARHVPQRPRRHRLHTGQHRRGRAPAHGRAQRRDTQISGYFGPLRSGVTKGGQQIE